MRAMNDGYASLVLARLESLFPAHANAERAAAMAKYMRNLFPYFGIQSPERRVVQREAVAGLPAPSESDLAQLSGRLWAKSEREYQYAALDVLSRHGKVLTPAFLPVAKGLITTKSWWDTVDPLAGGVVGGIVGRNRELATVMDERIESDNSWLVRTALLHQLGYKEHTDTARLFGYCLRRAGEREFFIRKAIGWALRQYSWTNPGSVRTFVAAHEAELSPLSKREALLAINGGRKKRPAASGEALDDVR
jgi:3-methyladenine DNA glycosylase AlkD